MKQLRIIPDKCTGCMQCELACSFVQTGTFQPSRSLIRVYLFDEQAIYSPYTCFQCEEAWCMTGQCHRHRSDDQRQGGARQCLCRLRGVHHCLSIRHGFL